MERVAETIGKEARALGITQVFAPSLDLARDPRHGRVGLLHGTTILSTLLNLSYPG